MKTIELTAAPRDLAEVAEEAGGKLVLLTRHRKPFMAMVPVDGLDEETISLSYNPTFLAVIEKAREEARRGETFSLDEIKTEFGL
ncbi:MAG TPA: hypothetical protein VK137_13570 [Planctomycetaceae bacterium]|nr:hypothetical protein [Planctomycetaceae bacterium]